MSRCSVQMKKAVRNALLSHSSISGIVSGVYDAVPDKTDYPFISISMVDESDWSSVARNGMRVEFKLNVYTRHNGTKQCLELAEYIYAALHHESLSLDVDELVSMRFMESSTRILDDGRTEFMQLDYHAYVYRALEV